MDTKRTLASEFVWDFFRTGLALTDLASALIEALPGDAYPGEEPGEVVLEMMTGTIQPAVDAAGADAVKGMIALMGATYDRVMADLEQAATLSRQHDAGQGG